MKVSLTGVAQGRALVEALAVSSRGPERVDRVRDVYLDTAERDLLAAGYALRLRLTNDDALEATLKSIEGSVDAGVVVREERTVAIDAPVRDPRLLPDGALRRLVISIVGRSPLVPLARVAGTRARRRLRVDTELVIESSVDRMTASADGHSTPIAELELELSKGEPAAFRAFVARAWSGQRIRFGTTSKLQRALTAARIRVPSALRITAARLSLEDVGPSTHSARAGGRDLARNAAELEHAVAAARRGSIEGVHDARTLTRRIRALLGFHAPDVDPALIEDARVRLRALRRAAGPVRECDVLADAIRAAKLDPSLEKGRVLLLDSVRAARAPLKTQLVKALDSPRLSGLAARWAGPAAELSRKGSLPFAVTAALRLPRSIEPALTARRAITGSFVDASASRIHALRIAAKRARYAVEACLPALGKPAKRFAKRLREFVDEAGALRDAEVHGAAVRAAVRALPTALGARSVAEKTAAALCEGFDAHADRARKRLDSLADKALGPASLRDVLEHLARRAADGR